MRTNNKILIFTDLKLPGVTCVCNVFPQSNCTWCWWLGEINCGYDFSYHQRIRTTRGRTAKAVRFHPYRRPKEVLGEIRQYNWSRGSNWAVEEIQSMED
ncbi:Putative Non-structural protein S [Hedwig virus]|uniref:Non-structural protein S n=1 Tax=Hedwig virus TaxID=2884278 RepID=A0A8J9TW03_9VIRU|nr:Putative Non-structural protein S [Hedwig virus]